MSVFLDIVRIILVYITYKFKHCVNRPGNLSTVWAAEGETDRICGWLLLARVPALLQCPGNLESLLEGKAG